MATDGRIGENLRRVAVSLLLIIALGANSASILECRSVAAQTSEVITATAEEAAVPDCCLDGMCPRHHAHPSSDSSPADCMHMSSHSTVIVGTAQMPAVFPVMRIAGVDFSIEERTRNISTPRLPDIDLSVLTPPPRS